MKQLSRLGIQRMIDGVGSAGNGGGSVEFGAGLASMAWVEEKYLSKDFFLRLFGIHGTDDNDDPVDVTPNDMDTTVTDIEAKLGFWSDSFVSAFGRSTDGGGGGGVTLYEPLNSINSINANPTSANRTLIWTGTQWTYSSIVTSVSMAVPTGFEVTGSPVSSTGTLALTFASGYSLPLTADVTKGVTAYGWGDHAQAGYALASNVYSKTEADNKFLPLSAGSGKPLTGTLYSQSIYPKNNAQYDLGGSTNYWRYLYVNRIYLASGVYLEYDSTNLGVHLVGAGFYSDSFVSAFGASTGGGGITLNQPLSSINSLNANPSSSGQTLVWNGTSWGYTTLGSGSVGSIVVNGTSYSSVNGVVTLPNYPTTLDNIADGTTRKLANYLPLTGGTLTGSGNILSLASSGSSAILYLKTTVNNSLVNSAAFVYSVGFACITNEATKARIGVADDGTPQYWDNSSGTSGHAFSLIHSGNIGSYNAGSATKLQTARTLWGQSFDGTANVDGALILNHNDSRTNYNEGIRINDVFTNPLIHFGGSGNSGTGENQWTIGLHNNKTFWALSYNSFSNCIIVSDTNGRVGIGTTSPSYKLHVNGTFYASGNSSVGGTFGVTGATTLSSTLSVASGITLTTTKRIYFGDSSHYIELDSTGFHFSHGLYSDSFVSAFGASTSSGGITLNQPLASINNLNANPSSSNKTLVWNGSAWTYADLGSGSVGSIVVNGTAYSSVNGVVTLPALLPLTGGTLTSSNNVLNIKSTTENSWIYFYSAIEGTSAHRAAVGYYRHFAFISNESHYERIGVTDGGIPQYWDNNTGGSGHVFDLLHSGNIGSYLANYLPLSGGTITGALGKSSNYLIKPVADFRTSTSTHRGCIAITLPATIGSTMVSMWIDVYNYSTNTSFSVHCGGYTYSNSTWQHNPFALVFGASHRVRFGHNGTSFVVYIGETDSTWAYPQVTVRDVVLGYSPTYANWYKDWTISFVTSVSNVTADITRYAITSDNIGSHNAATATKLQTERNIWGQSFDGSGDVSGNMTGVGSITASGTIKSTFYGPAFAAHTDTSKWSYMSYKSGDYEWHIGTVDSTAAYIGQAGAFEIRSVGDSYSGISIRRNTSSYGRLVVTSKTGECSIGLRRSNTTGNPQWVFGIISTNDRFGFFNTASAKFVANFSPDGSLYLGNGDTAASYKLHVNGTLGVTGATTLSSTLSVGGNTTPSATGTYNLGSSSLYWNYTYTNRLYLASGVYFVKDSNGVRLVGAGFYSDSFVSAFGASSGGGSLTLNEPLASINSASLGAASVAGQTLVYNGSAWKYSDTSGVTLKADKFYASTGITISNGNLNISLGNISLSGYVHSYGNIITNSKIAIGYNDVSSSYQFYCKNNGYISGTLTQGSDIRRKTIIGDVDTLDIYAIAGAPFFKFQWRDSDDDRIYAGTSAQYWQLCLPETVLPTGDGYLSMDYGVTALISTIITARKVVDHEKRIAELEAENEILRQEIDELKAA